MITEETLKELSDIELSEQINLLTEEEDRRSNVIKAKENWVTKSKVLPAYSSLRNKLIKELPNCDVLFPGVFDSDNIEVFSKYDGRYMPGRVFYKHTRLYPVSYQKCHENISEIYIDEPLIIKYLKATRHLFPSNVEMCICISSFFYSFSSRFTVDVENPTVCIEYCIFPKSDLKLNRHYFPFPY